MPETAGERTEAATPRRRTDARRRGTVAKSPDLTSALVTLSLLFALPTAVGLLGSSLLYVMRRSMGHLPTETSHATMLEFTSAALTPVLPGLAIVIGTVLVVAVSSNVAQVGLKLSPEAMIPNFAKINPLSGFKRLFSPQIAFEGVKALLKAGVFGWLAYSAIGRSQQEIGALTELSVVTSLSVIGVMIKAMAWRVIAAWTALAAFDYYFQRTQIDKSLRMSKDEIKREMKEADGSPEVKAARAQRRRKMKSQMMKMVRDADVVITNPTHYAIAIKYDTLKAPAPIVVAKGADFLATRIRAEAEAYQIPLVPNPPLARALYKQCEVGDQVPRELFQAVAEVLAYVYRVLQRARGQA